MKLLRVIKETFFSSLPLAAVIVVVCCFVAPMSDPMDYVKLAVGYAGVVIGQSLFLVGLDISILPIGKLMGESLVRLKKLVFIIMFGVIFGILATVAEPALAVLAKQTNIIMPLVNNIVFLWIASTGIGIFVGLALFRILKDINIKIIFAVFYTILFVLVFIAPDEFVALAFDGSGATTGDISVPFILALGMGVSVTMSKRKTNEDTFGIIGLASIGPIFSILIYGIILKAKHNGVIPPAGNYNPGETANFLNALVSNLGDVALALLPVIIVYLPFQFFLIKMQRKSFRKIMFGTIPVFIGLLIFLASIDFGFAFAGKYIGTTFLDPSRPPWFKWLLPAVGFILSAAITLSEPAVTVLGEQLEEITDGHMKKLTIRLTLAIGIGFAAVLSIIKILTEVNIIWFLLPLYAVALTMMIFTSKMFVGLAFDSGGVSGGALTSAFLTPLTLGVAQAVAENAGGGQSILINGFGMIAFISVTPMIAVQLLGIIYEINFRKVKRLSEAKELEDLSDFNSSEVSDFIGLNLADDDEAVNSNIASDTAVATQQTAVTTQQAVATTQQSEAKNDANVSGENNDELTITSRNKTNSNSNKHGKSNKSESGENNDER